MKTTDGALSPHSLTPTRITTPVRVAEIRFLIRSCCLHKTLHDTQRTTNHHSESPNFQDRLLGALRVKTITNIPEASS